MRLPALGAEGESGRPGPGGRQAGGGRPGGRGPSGLETDGECSDTVADEACVPGQLGFRDGQVQVGEAGEERLQGDGGLHPGERRAQAVVGAVAEREVLGPAARARSKRSASGPWAFRSRPAAEYPARTGVPRGMSVPSTVRSRVG